MLTDAMRGKSSPDNIPALIPGEPLFRGPGETLTAAGLRQPAGGRDSGRAFAGEILLPGKPRSVW